MDIRIQIMDKINAADELQDRCVIMDLAHGVFKIDRHGNMTGTHDRNMFLKELKEKCNYYVYDARQGATPMVDIRARMIIAASPNEHHYRQLRKMPNFQRIYMPVWDLVELQLCRVQCYPLVTAATVEHMFARVGGMARHVLIEETRVADNLGEFQRAVGAMSFARCVLCGHPLMCFTLMQFSGLIVAARPCELGACYFGHTLGFGHRRIRI